MSPDLDAPSPTRRSDWKSITRDRGGPEIRDGLGCVVGSGAGIGFRLTLSPAHLGPESGAVMGHAALGATSVRPAPEAA
jgi:hypothetical protein